MKYVFITEPDSQGIGEVFHTVLLPEADVPEGMIDRWNMVADSSPTQCLIVSGKENLAIGSSYNSETEEFTLPEGILENRIINPNNVTNLFLIDGKVVTAFTSKTTIQSPIDLKLRAAFAAPVTIVGLEDSTLVDLGYTWDGTNFTAPTDI